MTKIFTMTHKKFTVPEDSVYVPLQVKLIMKILDIWEMTQGILFQNGTVIMENLQEYTGYGKTIRAVKILAYVTIDDFL